MADREREQLEEAIRRAAAANDAEAVRRLGAYYNEQYGSGAQQPQQEEPTPVEQPQRGPGGVGTNPLEWLGMRAADINTGMAGLIPGGRQFAADLGIARAPGQGPDGAVGAGFEMVGESLPLAGLGVAATIPRYAATRIPGLIGQAPLRSASVPPVVMNEGQAVSTGGFRAGADRLGREMLDTAIQRPGLFFGSEALGGFGAGAMLHNAQNEGSGPMGQMISALTGGVLGGIAPGAAIDGVSTGRRMIAEHLFPMTDAGGRIRAQRATQGRAANPEASAREIEEWTRPGVTPARASGDEGLMAQEARVLADNPQMAAQVQTDLNTARVAAQTELRDSFGRPRSREDWERAVLERVSARRADGSTVAPVQGTHTDEMLESAYRSFDELYDAARGHQAQLRGEGGDITVAFYEAAADPDVLATPATRNAVESFLDNQARLITDAADGAGNVSTDVLIEARRRLRDKQRTILRGGPASAEDRAQAELLDNAESRLTALIERSLPENVAADLRAADQQYRQYKVVERALYNAGDLPLTPEQLSNAIRTSTQSPGRYARGQDQQERALREFVMSGRSTETVFDDPRRAAQMVRGLEGDDLRAVHANFAETLFQRARAAGETVDGQNYISGQKLLQDLNEQREVAQALGIPLQEFSRMQRVAREIARMEARSPAAVNDLLTDGPATIMQLGAAILGAKSGQNIAGRGLGSSLVIAQFMSNRARDILARLTGDQAARMMRDATTDPELFRALLTGRDAPRQRINEAAQRMQSWLIALDEPTAEAAANFAGTLPQPEIPGG